MSYNNDILIDLNKIPFFPETIPPNLCPTLNEIISLNSQLEKLSIDVYTQSLRVEIERAKWQELGSIIKRVRRDLISLNQLSNQIQYDVVNLHHRWATHRSRSTIRSPQDFR